MAKCGGIRDVVEVFNRLHREEGWRFLSPATVSRNTGISVERTKRILNRPSNAHLIRRSTGDREVYTLTEFD